MTQYTCTMEEVCLRSPGGDCIYCERSEGASSMTPGTGIAGAMNYQPREAGSAPNECATCGKDFGEGASKVAAAVPGVGLVQYCGAKCAPARSPAEEWRWMVERIRALEDGLEPFAGAWDVATYHKDVVARLTMAQLGELAAHEVSGVHFRNARALLTNIDKGES